MLFVVCTCLNSQLNADVASGGLKCAVGLGLAVGSCIAGKTTLDTPMAPEVRKLQELVVAVPYMEAAYEITKKPICVPLGQQEIVLRNEQEIRDFKDHVVGAYVKKRLPYYRNLLLAGLGIVAGVAVGVWGIKDCMGKSKIEN